MTEGNGTEDVTVPTIVRGFSDPDLEVQGHGTEITVDSGIKTGTVVGGSRIPLSSAERPAIVTARGTAEGLLLRIESGASREAARLGLWNFMDSRRNFIAGNELIIEWGSERLDESFVADLQAELAKEFEVVFKDPRAVPAFTPPSQSVVNTSHGSGKLRSPSLFDGIEALGVATGGTNSNSSSASSNGASGRVSSQQAQSKKAGHASVWDDADARLIYGTLRSGQKVETEHSLIVVGDVNSGAEIVAGGDVMVMGCLRGIAHAGAYDETGGGRMIFALTLQPTQLRIGGVISRGGASEGYAGPEVARVDGTLIVVEAYNSRTAGARR